MNYDKTPEAFGHKFVSARFVGDLWNGLDSVGLLSKGKRTK